MKENGKTVFGAYKRMMMVQVVSAMTAFLGVLVDSIVVSRFLSMTDMAAFGFVQPVTLIFAALALIFSTGAQALCGKHLGRGEVDEVNRVTSLALTLSVLFGVVLSVALFLFSTPISILFGAEGETVEAASLYLKGFAPGATFLLLGPVMTNMMQIDGDNARSFLSVGAMTAVNIALDLANVFLFHGGMLGMSLATTVSGAVNIAIMTLHFRKPGIMLHPSFRKARFSRTGELVLTGFPAANQQLCTVLRTAVLNGILLGLGGTAAVAAFTAECGVMPMVTAILKGFGVTVLLVAGMVIGEEDRASLEVLMGRVFRLGLLIALGLGLVIFAFARQIALFYVATGDAAQLALVARAFRFYAVSLPLTMLTTLFIHFYQSMERLLLANILCIAENALLVILVSLALSGWIGMDAVWASFVIAEGLTLLSLAGMSLFRQKKLPRRLTDFLLIPKTFGLPEARRMNITAVSREEAALISQGVVDFCLRQGLSRKQTLFSGICLEEMAVLALENSAVAGKTCQVDVFLSLKDGVLTLRLKDNGVPFDPAAQYARLNPEDPAAHVALRMFYRMARDVEYKNVFGLNMLTFRIV